MFPHLNRDLWPKREWLDPRPSLQAWVGRASSGQSPTGDLLANDEIPQSLTPLFKALFSEFPEYIERAVARLRGYVAKNTS